MCVVRSAAHRRPRPQTTDHRPPTPHDRQPGLQIPGTHRACKAKGRLIRHQCTTAPTPQPLGPARTNTIGRLRGSSASALHGCCVDAMRSRLVGWLAGSRSRPGRQPRLSNRIATRQSWTRHASADAGPGGELAAWLVNRGPAGRWAAGCHRADVGRGVGELAVWQRAARPYTVHICATTRGRIPEQTQHGTQAAEKSGARVEALRSARKWRSRNLTAAGQGGLAVWCNLQMPCWVWTLLMTSSWPGL